MLKRSARDQAAGKFGAAAGSQSLPSIRAAREMNLLTAKVRTTSFCEDDVFLYSNVSQYLKDLRFSLFPLLSPGPSHLHSCCSQWTGFLICLLESTFGFLQSPRSQSNLFKP